MKKPIVHSEPLYVFATVLLAFAVATVTAADFGVSMVVAPAYVLSLYVDFLSFGQAEYVVQGVLFIAFCLLMRKFRVSYLFAFASCLLYGLVLDLWRLIPIFTTPAETLGIWWRVAFFVVGELLTALSVAMFFKSYLPPQVNDYFVMGVSERYNIKRSFFKFCFDAGCLVVALVTSLCFFGEIRGVGVGTVIITAVNGFFIGAFSKALDALFEVKPLFPKLKEYFER